MVYSILLDELRKDMLFGLSHLSRIYPGKIEPIRMRWVADRNPFNIDIPNGGDISTDS